MIILAIFACLISMIYSGLHGDTDGVRIYFAIMTALCIALDFKWTNERRGPY